MFTATPETEIDYIVTLQMYIYLPLYCMHLLVALDTVKTSNINPKDHLQNAILVHKNVTACSRTTSMLFVRKLGVIVA